MINKKLRQGKCLEKEHLTRTMKGLYVKGRMGVEKRKIQSWLN